MISYKFKYRNNLMKDSLFWTTVTEGFQVPRGGKALVFGG